MEPRGLTESHDETNNILLKGENLRHEIPSLGGFAN